MKGAEWLVQSMAMQGIRNIFGYPGGAIMPIYDALYGSNIEHILCRHEQGAAIAAIGYARATGKVGVCMATSGPGATNLITGLADALLDSVPIVAITGQVASPFIGSDAFQEIDILGLSLGCTKHSFLVQSVEALPSILEQAFKIAQEGRPGPVLIDIPKDIQLADIDINPLKWHKTTHFAAISSEDIQQANLLLQQAQRPILYIGGGVQIANATAALRTFISQSNIPSVETLKALGSVDYQHPYYLGMLGMHGSKEANLAVQQSDLLLVIGARFDDRVTGKLATFAPNAKVIHIDIDRAELGKMRHANVGLLGDLNQIIPLLSTIVNIQGWQQQITELKRSHTLLDVSPENKTISAATLLKQLSLKTVSTNSIFTTDVGQHQMWAAQYIKVTDPHHFITSSGLGTMGFGLPAAVGAKIALPDRQVICITGDGSFMMNIQEMNTLKRYGLPIKIILFDNQRLGMVRQWQQLFFEQRYSETELLDNPDFVLLAQAFNIQAKMISEQHEVNTALDELLSSQTAYLLHVRIDPFENVWPLVPPGVANQMMLDQNSLDE